MSDAQESPKLRHVTRKYVAYLENIGRDPDEIRVLVDKTGQPFGREAKRNSWKLSVRLTKQLTPGVPTLSQSGDAEAATKEANASGDAYQGFPFSPTG